MANFFSKLLSNRALAAVDAAEALDTRPLVAHTEPDHYKMALDNLRNFVTGMGTMSDKAEHSHYFPEVGMSRNTASAIVRSSWVAKRIVNTVADDMVREWRDVMWDGSQDDEVDGVFGIQQEEKRLKVRKRVHTAIKWARQFGGSLIVMVIKGQTGKQQMELPLEVEKIKKGSLLNLVVYDRWRLYGTPPDKRDFTVNPDILVPYLNQTLDDPNYGSPEFYFLADTSSKIHHSRCIRFDGEELDWYEWNRNAMWHDSVLKSVERVLKSYGTLMAGCLKLVTEASLDVVSAKGFSDLLSTDGGTNQAQIRYQMLNLMKSMYGLVVLDKEDESYERKPMTFSGLRDLLDRMSLDVAGAANMPVSKIFGQSATGLNATGEGDSQNYENDISGRQESDLSPQMTQLDEVLVRSALGRMPPDFRFEWKPLRQTTPAQQAQIDYQVAQRDGIYLQNEVVRPVAVARELRFAGTYPNLTQEDVDEAEDVGEQLSPGMMPPGSKPGIVPPGLNPQTAKPAAVVPPPVAKAKPEKANNVS
jgi:phage-related protein (TIGR01555 family)